MPRARRATLTTVLAAVVVVGCSVTQPAPVKRAFLLDPPPPAARSAADGAPVLRVNRFVAAQPFDGKSFVYRLGDQRFELDHYHEFLAFPATMFTENTMRHLAATGRYRAVVPMTSSVDTRLTLEGAVTQLYGDLREAVPAAVMEIRFLLAREEPGARVLYDRTLGRRVAAEAKSADALVAAFDRALAEILTDLARDLAAISSP